MKADKPLEWALSTCFPNQWQASTEFHGFMDSYTLVPSEKHGGWSAYVPGVGTRAADSLEGAKQICQDHYNRELRLKAWEAYMLTHEPPEDN